MRQIVSKFLVACLSIASIVACSEKEEYLFGAKDPFVEIKASDENDGFFTPEAQSGYALMRSNARWKAESLTDWLSCQTIKGEFNDTIRFQMTTNTGNVRMGKIVVSNTIGEQKFDTLTITQGCDARFIPAGYTIKIQSDEAKKVLSGEEFSEIPFNVESPTAWRVYTKTADSWSTVLSKRGVKNGTGTLVVSKNDLLEERSMYVYVQSISFPTLKDSIKITQAGRPLKVSVVAPRNKKVMLDESEAKFMFTVQTDGKWRIEDIPSWLHIEKTEYEGDANITVTADASSGARTAQLRIKSLVQPDKTDILTVEQKIIPAGRMKDSLALVAIYQATNGEHWTYPWKFELPLSDSNWPGVFFDEVDGQLRVIDLSLGKFNLEGTLPNELGWLTEVIKIKFYENNLSGPLPASINRLTKLTHIFLRSNKLSGEFPDIPALQSLTSIDIDFNRFEGEFPESFSMLPKLTSLKMKYNQFSPNTCVPKRFGGWRLNLYISPQRAVYGDAKTDYKLVDCAN